MPERKTVGQLMEEMRLKAGAQNYHGHEYMDLERFAEDTRHMIIFDVLTHDSPVGWKGERTRLFLTEAGYQKSLENQEKGHIKNSQPCQGAPRDICTMTAPISCVEREPAMMKYLLRAAGGPALVSSATPAKSVERRR